VAIGFCDEICTVGPQPVLCAACWRAILLEDESGGGEAGNCFKRTIIYTIQYNEKFALKN